MEKLNLESPYIRLLSETAAEENAHAYLIGGYVRDLLLKRDHKKDIDVVVEGSGIDFARAVAGRMGKEVKVHYFKNFGTAMIHHNEVEIEFVGARK